MVGIWLTPAGAGVTLKNGSILTDRTVHRRLRTLAEARDIAHQFDIPDAGGPDTAELQHTACAVPVVAVSLPAEHNLAVVFLETETGSHDYALLAGLAPGSASEGSARTGGFGGFDRSFCRDLLDVGLHARAIEKRNRSIQ